MCSSISGSSTQHKGVTPDILLPSALDAAHYGESANPSALPWDVIKAVPFQRASDVNDKTIAILNQSFQDRMKGDAGLRKYASDTEELKRNLSQTKISLSEVIRKKELEEVEKKKAAEKLDVKLTTTKEGLPVNDLQKLDDEFLREGLLILSELLTKRIG